MTHSTSRDFSPDETTINRNRRERRNAIIEAAAELFAKTGYAGTSMVSVGDHLGINKATLYHYYKSKAEILLDIINVTIDRFAAITSAATKMTSAADALEYLISRICDVSAGERSIAIVYFQEERYLGEYLDPQQLEDVSQRGRQIMQDVFEIIERGEKSGEFIQTDTHYVGRLLIGMILWVYRWPEPEIDGERVARAANALVISGLLAKRGER